MAAHFTIPASPGRKVQKVDQFLGVDLTNDPKNVDLCRSPSAPNMIRDVPGKVRKCMGYEQTAAYKGGIYGAYTLRGQSETLLPYQGLAARIHEVATLFHHSPVYVMDSHPPPF